MNLLCMVEVLQIYFFPVIDQARAGQDAQRTIALSALAHNQRE
jgi:hypothetical protein